MTLMKSNVRSPGLMKQYGTFCGARCVDFYTRDGRYCGTALPAGEDSYVIATWSDKHGQWQSDMNGGSGMSVCGGTGPDLDVAGRALAAVGARRFKIIRK